MITTPNVEPLSETIPSESTGPGSATEVDSRGKKLSTKELMLLNCGLEQTLQSSLDSKEIKPGNSKGNQS